MLQDAIKMKNTPLNYLEYNGKIICVNCTQASYQLHRSRKRNNDMKVAINTIVSTSHYSWRHTSNHMRIPSSMKYFKEQFKYHKMFVDDNMYQQILRQVDIVKIDIHPIHKKGKYSQLITNLSGSDLPDKFDINTLKKCTLSRIQQKDVIGVIDFKRKNNFIIITPSNISDRDDILMAKHESSYIQKMTYAGRAGSAGGFVLHDTNSHSLTKCTQKPSTVFINHKKGVGASVVYKNNNNDIKLFNGVYNDVLMRRLSNTQKKSELLKHDFLRRVHIEEMKNRLMALLVAIQCRLLSKNHQHPIKIIQDIIENKMTEVHEFKSLSHTLLESILLVWSTSTGQMNNHSALKAHKDGNKSHEVETMTLFGRCHSSMKNDKKSSTVTPTKRFKSGYLIFPLDGFVIKMHSSTMNIHCNLKNTLHIPDKSRDTHNWTKVHGPK
jgi:ribosomal protein S8